MTTRANWHTAELAELADWAEDPFEAPIEEVGAPIDLGGPEARLHIELAELVRREANLDRVGITCPIKDRPDTTCHACPVSEAARREKPIGSLCRLGREQERVLTALAVHQVPECPEE